MAKKAVKAKAKKKAPVTKKRKPRAKKKVLYMDMKDIDPKEYLEVKVINDTTDNLPEVLGITEERHKELATLAFEASKKHSKISDTMVTISKGCKHANELVYAIFVYADVKGKMSNPLSAILGAIVKGGPFQP